MISQVFKDFRITRIFWAPAVFSFSVFLFIFFQSRWAYFIAGILLTMISAILILLIDDLYHTNPMFAGLPGSRKTIVAGRYLTWAIVSVAGLVITFATAAAILAALSGRAVHLGALLSIRWGLGFLISSACLGSVYLPFYFRFGLGKGSWIFSTVCLGILVTFSFLAPALSRSAGRTTDSVPGVPSSLLSTYLVLQRIAGRAGELLQDPRAIFIIWIPLTVLIYLSLNVSTAFYQKRDL